MKFLFENKNMATELTTFPLRAGLNNLFVIFVSRWVVELKMKYRLLEVGTYIFYFLKKLTRVWRKCFAVRIIIRLFAAPVSSRESRKQINIAFKCATFFQALLLLS